MRSVLKHSCSANGRGGGRMGPVVSLKSDVGCPSAQRRECRCRWMSRVEKEKGWTGTYVGIRKYCALVACAFSGGGSLGSSRAGRNYDLRAPVNPQVKQEASTPWLLHLSRRFDASKQRVSSWTVGILGRRPRTCGRREGFLYKTSTSSPQDDVAMAGGGANAVRS